MGFLHSTPENWKETRLQYLQRRKKPLDLPEIRYGGYLVDVLFAAGPLSSNGMGETPLTWLDIWAFAQATKKISEPWEYQTIIEMSSAYLRCREAGKSPLNISPAEQKRNEDKPE